MVRLVALAIVIRLQVVLGPLGAGGAPTHRPQVAPRQGFVRPVEIFKSSAAVDARIASSLARG